VAVVSGSEKEIPQPVATILIFNFVANILNFFEVLTLSERTQVDFPFACSGNF
jgi:hypothetical protein